MNTRAKLVAVLALAVVMLTGPLSGDEPQQASQADKLEKLLTQRRDIPNVGPSLADKLRLIGVLLPQDLLGKDPYTMHDDLCHATGVRHDPCVIDVFIAAVRFMAGEPSKPWWKFTAERKRVMAARAT